MKIKVPNTAKLSRDELRTRISNALDSPKAVEYKVKPTWIDAKNKVSFTCWGVKKGMIFYSYGGGVEIDAKLTWAARPFQSKIKAELTKMIEEAMRGAKP